MGSGKSAWSYSINGNKALKVGDGFAMDFDAFFDRPMVEKRLTSKRAKVLGSVGRFTRKVMRRSMRKPGKKRKHSRPGEPPYRIKGGIHDTIVYNFLGAAGMIDGVGVGPVDFGTGSVSVPELLNFGGQKMITLPPQWGGGETLATYEARPFATENSEAYVAGTEFFLNLIRDTDFLN